MDAQGRQPGRRRRHSNRPPRIVSPGRHAARAAGAALLSLVAALLAAVSVDAAPIPGDYQGTALAIGLGTMLMFGLSIAAQCYLYGAQRWWRCVCLLLAGFAASAFLVHVVDDMVNGLLVIWFVVTRAIAFLRERRGRRSGWISLRVVRRKIRRILEAIYHVLRWLLRRVPALGFGRCARCRSLMVCRRSVPLEKETCRENRCRWCSQVCVRGLDGADRWQRLMGLPRQLCAVLDAAWNRRLPR